MSLFLVSGFFIVDVFSLALDVVLLFFFKVLVLSVNDGWGVVSEVDCVLLLIHYSNLLLYLHSVLLDMLEISSDALMVGVLIYDSLIVRERETVIVVA